LAVEEQFYLVYPMLMVMAASIARRHSLRIKLGAVLCVTIVVSFAWSIVASPVSINAYVSPFTRAWELAAGALLALFASSLRNLPSGLAAAMTWIGLATLVVAAVLITGPDWVGGGYPGYLATLPVGATVLIIAGGTASPPGGTEALLRLAPFKWVGNWSYSIYLWHYPVLIIAAQRWHTTVPTNLLLAGGAVALSAGTYFAVENPIRHWSVLTRFPLVSVAGGIGLILAGLAIVDLVG
jgi:peptidoglycan/LPS O-acetylase OafA/YrhL